MKTKLKLCLKGRRGSKALARKKSGLESEGEKQQERLEMTSAFGRVRSETNCGKLISQSRVVKVEKVTTPPQRISRPEGDPSGREATLQGTLHW